MVFRVPSFDGKVDLRCRTMPTTALCAKNHSSWDRGMQEGIHRFYVHYLMLHQALYPLETSEPTPTQTSLSSPVIHRPITKRQKRTTIRYANTLPIWMNVGETCFQISLRRISAGCKGCGFPAATSAQVRREYVNVVVARQCWPRRLFCAGGS